MKFERHLASKNDLEDYIRRLTEYLDAGLELEVCFEPVLDPLSDYAAQKREAMDAIAETHATEGIEAARSLKATSRAKLRPLFWKAWYHAKKNGLEYPKQLRNDS